MKKISCQKRKAGNTFPTSPHLKKKSLPKVKWGHWPNHRGNPDSSECCMIYPKMCTFGWIFKMLKHMVHEVVYKTKYNRQSRHEQAYTM